MRHPPLGYFIAQHLPPLQSWSRPARCWAGKYPPSGGKLHAHLCLTRVKSWLLILLTAIYELFPLIRANDNQLFFKYPAKTPSKIVSLVTVWLFSGFARGFLIEYQIEGYNLIIFALKSINYSQFVMKNRNLNAIFWELLSSTVFTSLEGKTIQVHPVQSFYVPYFCLLPSGSLIIFRTRSNAENMKVAAKLTEKTLKTGKNFQKFLRFFDNLVPIFFG